VNEGIGCDLKHSLRVPTLSAVNSYIPVLIGYFFENANINQNALFSMVYYC